MKRAKSKKPSRHSAQKKKSALISQYNQFFAASPGAVGGKYGESLEQPSPFKSVPTVVTYGIHDLLPVASFNA